MKRLTFKKPFNGMDNALKLIPESYKVDGKEFQITDGTETYNIRWDINEATVLRAENKNLINEDMNKIKHLMGFKSQETLGNLKGEERLNENSSFTDVWNKTKSLLSESKEEVNEMEKGIHEEGEEGGSSPVSIANIRDKIKDILYSLNKKKFSGKERKVTYGLLHMINQLGGEENSYSPKLVKFLELAQQALDDKSEPKDATSDLAQQAMSANQNEQKDRFDEIFEDMYTEEEKEVKNPGKYTTGMKKGYDTDGDGVPDGADKDPYDGNIQEDK